MPRLLRLLLELAEHLLTDAATPTAGLPAATSDANTVAELRAETLHGCAPLLLRGMTGCEDAPLQEAACAAHAGVAYLRLAAMLPPAQLPEAPSPRAITAGLLGLFRLRRSAKHADLLRLQGALLPVLPALFELRPTADLLAIIKDGTRPSPATVAWIAATPEMPLDARALRDAKVGTLIASCLTATCVLATCPASTRLILRDMLSIGEVIKGLDQTFLTLLRARCASAGGLHRLMAANLEWLVSWSRTIRSNPVDVMSPPPPSPQKPESMSSHAAR